MTRLLRSPKILIGLILSASFDKDGEDPPGGATGILSLYYGDRKVGEGRIKNQPGDFELLFVAALIGADQVGASLLGILKAQLNMI